MSAEYIFGKPRRPKKKKPEVGLEEVTGLVVDVAKLQIATTTSLALAQTLKKAVEK